MFVIRERRGDRSVTDQDRTTEDSTQRPETGDLHSSFTGRDRGAAARADLERRLRANENTLNGLIEASVMGADTQSAKITKRLTKTKIPLLSLRGEN